MNISPEKVIVVTAHDPTAQQVSQSLESYENWTVMTRCNELEELMTEVENEPSVVLVDIDPMPDVMLLELMPIIVKHTATCFIILSSGWDEKLVLEAMEIGARHFMRKSSISKDLVTVMRRLAITGEIAPRSLGNVITILSAGGGCGATTLAVNITNELHMMGTQRLLLIDMDIAYGAIGTYLDISGQYGLADIMVNRNGVDGDLVVSSAVPYENGINVLLSPASVDYKSSGQINFEDMDKVLDVCRQTHDFTIVDAPRISPEIMGELASISSAILIVLQLSVKDVRITKKIFNLLEDAGVDDSRIFPVINRYSKKGMSVNLDETKRALGSNNIQIINNDFHNAQRSIDLGEPVAKIAPMSALRKDIKKMLDNIPLSADIYQEGRHERA